MPEIPQPGVNGQEFSLNIVRTPDVSADPEIQVALDWYKERLGLLPEMRVEKAPVTDGDKWKGEIKDGQVEGISGAQFTIEGRDVSSIFSWRQPIINQSRDNGISGIIILARNKEGKYFMTVAQEPAANKVEIKGKETHPVVRTPIQTSVTKLQQLVEGRQEVDPTLYGVLSALSGEGRTMNDIVSSIPLKEVKTDANRIDSSVVYGVIDVNDDLASNLEQVTGGMFLSRKQISAIDSVNGHTHVALSVASEQ